MVFVLEKNGDIELFDSINEAESALESPDIEAGEYLYALSEDGTKYRIEPERKGRTRRLIGIEVVDISRAKLVAEGDGKRELLRILRKLLGLSDSEQLSIEEGLSRVRNAKAK